MNKEELKQYLEENYKEQVKESKDWMTKFEEEFNASTNPKKSWAIACSKYMKGGALGVYFAAREIFTGEYKNQADMPKIGDKVCNIDTFQNLSVTVQYRCIALHTKAHKELNNIEMDPIMDQMAELFITDKIADCMIRGTVPHYVKGDKVFKEPKLIKYE